jgi:hypothetical protein
MSWNKTLSLLAAMVAVSAISSPTRADTLLIEGIERSAQSSAERPRRGMTMERVETMFGSPSEKIAPVGDPPIARWEYPSFTVYFEYDKVLHSVERR